MFSSEFWEISKNAFSYKTHPVDASAETQKKRMVQSIAPKTLKLQTWNFNIKQVYLVYQDEGDDKTFS